MSHDITTIGEVLIDLVQTKISDSGIFQFAANPGGAPANVAVAVSKLAGTSAFIGCTGNDKFGDILKNTLIENKVDVRAMCQSKSTPTTLAVVSVDEKGERSFAFYRSPGADQLISIDDVPLPLIRDGKILHFGSVSLTGDPARAATLYAAKAAKEMGIMVSYDPNFRDALWNNRINAEKEIREPLNMVDILKISDEEMEIVTGENTWKAAAEKMHKKGIRLVLITLGADGVYYSYDKLSGTVPGFKVKVADTNGAGDTFFAATLSKIAKRGSIDNLKEDELEKILTFANKAASLTTSRVGAIPAMPTLEEVERELSNI